MKNWAITVVSGALLLVGAAALFVGSLWAIDAFVDDKQVRLAAAFLVGLAFLLAIISGIVAAFSALRLTNPKSPLGLPEGSIRAIIALILIVLFVVMAIYLIEAVYLAQTSPAARNAATQLLATVGTLVAAVAAFYFGTGAVATGAAAAVQAANVAQAGQRKPLAITKGSTQVDGGYELVGVVNPYGQDTKYYFEYGESDAYGQATPIASAGAVEAEQEVRNGPIAEIVTGWHVRLVALNESGASYGADSEVGGA